MATVWVVYDSGHEQVLGVFSTEAKAADYAWRKSVAVGREDDVGIYILWGEMGVDDENAKPVRF